jgi:hypothetical protein
MPTSARKLYRFMARLIRSRNAALALNERIGLECIFKHVHTNSLCLTGMEDEEDIGHIESRA